MREVKRLGISMATLSRMARIADEEPSQRPLPRRAIVPTLGAAGLRVGELCALDWADLDFAHTRIKVRDAKTPAGVREIEMSPWLRDELLSYRQSLGSVTGRHRSSRPGPASGASRTTFARGSSLPRCAAPTRSVRQRADRPYRRA